MNWRFCIQMCTVYCIYNVISIHHPNIYEMYLFTGGESGRRAGWPRSRSDGEHHGEAAPSLLTNGLPSNLRRPIRPPSDQVEDLALLPPWWVLSFVFFFFLFCSTQVMGTPPAQQEIPSSPISSIPSSPDSAAIRWLLTHYQGFFDSFLSNCCFCFQLVAFCKKEACRGCVRCVIPD